MKSEPKAFASLSSGLLARKGAARPAMRPQGFGQPTGNLDDLGWNDMGFEPPKPSSTPLRDVHAAEDAAARVPFAGLTPLESPVHSQQAEIADRLASIEDAVQPFEDEAAHAPVPTAVEPEPADVSTEQVDFAATESDREAEEQEVYVPTLAEQRIVISSDALAEPEAVIAPAPAAAPAPKAASAPSPRRMPKARTVQGAKGKAAFTLRLDPDRHLKLRLACAVGARSAQQFVTDALDQLLASMPELDAMAENAKRKGS